MKNRLREILIVALDTAFMGQVNFYPFGTDFRISVGVVLFTFLLLYFHSAPIIGTAIVTGLSVLFIRVGIDVYVNLTDLEAAYLKHTPAMLFYISYGIILEGSSFRKLFDNPIYFIITLTAADTMSNFLELLVRNQLKVSIFDEIFSTIMLAAAIRSCMVMALFWTIKHYSLFITEEEHQSRYKELLLLTAKLKSEVFFLKKSMQDIEGAMAKSYSIYNTLKEQNPINKEDMGGILEDCLNLSVDIHEIKKDYHRIVTSMEKLMPTSDEYKTMKVSEIFETIKDIFTRYLEVINKDIRLSFQLEKDFRTQESFLIMSILNNLIQNSIEACFRNDSFIDISCFIQDQFIIFRVRDNGKGIKEKDQELIFEPGFTTKFNPETGQVSTGLGLTHIKILSDHLHGRITLHKNIENLTEFRLELPVSQVVFEEDDNV